MMEPMSWEERKEIEKPYRDLANEGFLDDRELTDLKCARVARCSEDGGWAIDYGNDILRHLRTIARLKVENDKLYRDIGELKSKLRIYEDTYMEAKP